MKKYKIVFSVPADGVYLLWNVSEDVAEVEAKNSAGAAQVVRRYCHAWHYNAPIIHSITQIS